ncbi:MAG: glycosyltransferase, partial [Nitrospinaceae bacterium]|nr:glycosyltransferase [Nitrospinaceae bacterium]NIR53388.1 glycosyltransferase [Nitrospinaceae bacterium]NIS83792.1 glycosyltransferase [Nitrospinaceae bacterium]NIT80591.1 glycosyltransferase [Nitrospinaceae bacterium]NIU42912.1 glycosyltransferase [Nitrospinaceae bacterium]
IPPLVDGLIACYGDYLREVILVDDNSTDGTAEVGEELSRRDARVRVIRRPMPNGVGRALRDGFAAVRGDYVLTL